jgi:hypothetical protein
MDENTGWAVQTAQIYFNESVTDQPPFRSWVDELRERATALFEKYNAQCKAMVFIKREREHDGWDEVSEQFRPYGMIPRAVAVTDGRSVDAIARGEGLQPVVGYVNQRMEGSELDFLHGLDRAVATDFGLLVLGKSE